MRQRRIWLTEEEIAAALGLSLASARNWIARESWELREVVSPGGDPVRVFGVPCAPASTQTRLSPALASLVDGSLLAEVRAFRDSLEKLTAARKDQAENAGPLERRLGPARSASRDRGTARRSRLRSLQLLDSARSTVLDAS